MPMLHALTSTPAHFTGALESHGMSDVASIAFPAGGTQRWYIRAVSIASVSPIIPALYFLAAPAPLGKDPFEDRVLGVTVFSEEDRQQVGDGLYRYYKDGLAIPYTNINTPLEDKPSALHLGLVNAGKVRKEAGEKGSIAITVWVEPMGVTY